MSTYIFDIDGTLTRFHTNEWLPGSFELLKNLHNKGHDILLITARCTERDEGREWSPKKTRETLLKDLEEHGIEYRILFGIESPRILIDDANSKAVNRKQNESWFIKKSSQENPSL